MVLSNVSFLRAVGLLAGLFVASSYGHSLRSDHVAHQQQQQHPGCEGDDSSADMSTPSPTPAPVTCEPVSTRPSNWYIAAEASDYNNQVIGDMLSNLVNIRNKGEAYAVFDWDNTCTYSDISYTSVYYQMTTLNYRIPAEKFQEVFALGYSDSVKDECLPLGTNTVLGKDIEGNPVTLKRALEETAADYKQLYDAYIAPTYGLNSSSRAMPLEEVKQIEAFKNFRAKLSFLVFGLEASYGHKEMLPCAQVIGMTVFTMLQYGMTEEDQRSLIRASVRWNLGAQLDTPSFTSSGSLAVKGDYMTGLRVFNGQETVMRALRAHGAEVYIVSASPQLYVEEVGSLTGLTNMVPRSNVYSVRQEYVNGRFTGKPIENYPITWGPGKAEIVEKILKPKHNGKAPIFASGDSSGDCQMLDTVRDGVIHVNNRLKTSTCIYSFYEKACKYFNASEPETNNKYLLQGQDKGTGIWVPSAYSTKDGITFEITVEGCEAYKFM